ncbi:MAG: metallophosphoesterase [Myxococcota bacterium]
MRLALLSDSHMKHDRLHRPDADIVIHAGDFTRRGGEEETVRFLDWFASFPAPRKVLVAGNHDVWCEREPERFRSACSDRDITYLCDEGVTIAGLRFWGSPVTPKFRSMAFNRERGDDIQAHWAQIPQSIDVLVTHGPPHGILDRIVLGMHVGCERLLASVSVKPPRLHVFGHIHEAAGEEIRGGCRFVNAAVSKLLLGTRTPRTVDLRSAVREHPETRFEPEHRLRRSHSDRR